MKLPAKLQPVVRALLLALLWLARVWNRGVDWCLLRFGVSEPRLKRATRISVTVHVLIFASAAIPMLLESFGCIEAYRIPAGEKPKMQVVQVKVVKKQKLVVDPFSEVAFDWPKIEEAEANLDQITAAAKAGAGLGGTGMGGKGEGEIRFIRMEHNGDWDNAMAENAGLNMIREFHVRTGIPVRLKDEHHAIRLLRKYPKDAMPPFVYITGSRHFTLSSTDLKTLKAYIENGGMIFGDCCDPGGFDHYFRRYMTDIVPEGRWVTIPRDDEIFRKPYVMDGAPPLWHHAGYFALGIKYQGRWAVFYHPGDLGDAWKDGHGGIAPAKAEAAYALGVNVIFYSVEKYLDTLQKQAK